MDKSRHCIIIQRAKEVGKGKTITKHSNIKVLTYQHIGISHSHQNYNCKASKINNCIPPVFTVHKNVMQNGEARQKQNTSLIKFNG